MNKYFQMITAIMMMMIELNWKYALYNLNVGQNII